MSQVDQKPEIAFYRRAWDAFAYGDLVQLEAMTDVSSFPCGTDGWLGDHWVSLAILTGNQDALGWVLSKGAVPHYVGPDGFTALKSALQVETDYNLLRIERPKKSPSEVARVVIGLTDQLIDAGVDIN